MTEVDAVLSWFEERAVRTGGDEGVYGSDQLHLISVFFSNSKIWFKVMILEDGTLMIIDMDRGGDDEDLPNKKFRGHLSDPKLFEKMEDYLDVRTGDGH